VQLIDTPNGVLLAARLTRAPAGVHGFHLHETGKCDAPSFESAGGHFNPTKGDHGFYAANGPHAGDLPNLHVPADGRLELEVLAAGVSLAAGANNLLDTDGAALVLHAGADDYKTDPAGDAGDRVACGVIVR
jgi:Cu-Zn family superoxide dismutase